MGNKNKTSALSALDIAILDWLLAVAGSDHTRIAYAANLRTFLAGRDYLTITIQDIRDWQKSLRREVEHKRMAIATMGRKIAAVRSFYRYLNREEKTSLNLDQLDKMKVLRRVDHNKLLTESEVRAILKAAEPDNMAHIFTRFLYLTAVRVSEALNLKWREIESLMENDGQANITGKGGEHRKAYLTPDLWADLMGFRGSADDSDLVFPALTPHSAWRLIKRLGKAAKISKPVSPHSFRHAHLSHALKNGATIVEARDQAGHGSINTTSLYLHADGERATAKRLKIV